MTKERKNADHHDFFEINFDHLMSLHIFGFISNEGRIEYGCSNLQPFCPPKPEDVATICYTSGTTRTPKVWRFI
ncbi:Long chain acyl-CoA synthetase 7 peroxisomal [Trifolium repens]|nr:Long chain acyl-CoA synthetase 7 peroxisomal [Trifolium repens]WJX51826.1 Long chain acyl-CoA synthetase 7 peroxisomal [Trifolium repens]